MPRPFNHKGHMTLKKALSEMLTLAAASVAYTRTLNNISQEMPEAQFQRIVGQHPDTLERDYAWAEARFTRIKAEYEKHCAEIGEPPYMTYNED